MKRWSIVFLLLMAPLAVIFILWLALARPIFTAQGSYQPEKIVDPHVLQQHVETLSVQLFPRSHNHPPKLQAVANYIQQQLQGTGGKIKTQSYEVGGKTYQNVLAEYGPETAHILVVGAHYDTYEELPGADDNASGIAGLLALGKLLGQTKLDTRIVLAAYTLEEPPFFYSNNMGSAVHARSLKKKDQTVDLMICLEMIGFFTEAPDSQDYPNPLLHLYYPPKGNFITIVDQLFSNQARPMKQLFTEITDIPTYSINAPSAIEGVDFSDHRSFWNEGYPAIMVTDTAFYRNKAYHTSEDTADRLDYPKMAQVVYGVYQFLKVVSNQDS